MSGDYPDIPFVQAGGHGGNRTYTQMVVIHATDNTASDTNEANYATHRPDQISAHFYSDEDSIVQGVLLAQSAYGCYPTGNSRSVQFELVGLSNHLTDATLRRVAPYVRRVCDKYGIPIRHVGPADLRAGAKGICGHGDVTLAWGEGNHTDPGANFPWATFISYVNGSAATEETDMDFNQNAKLDAVFNAYPKVTLDTDATPDGVGAKGEFPVPLVTMLARIEAKLDKLAVGGVDLVALAKAVNDDAARRLAS